MAHPIAYGVNRLRTGLVTVQGEAADRPAIRLYDGFQTLEWEDAAIGTRTIVLDQGASPLAIDSVLGITHNLAGLTLTADHDDNAGFSSPATLGTVVPTAGAPFRITGTASSERYWRLTIASAGSAPRLGELFFSKAVEFPYGPSDQDLTRGRLGNVIKHESQAGVVLSYRRGTTRWTASLTIADLNDATQLTPFATLFDDLDGGGRSFFYLDEDGVLRWAEWVNPEVIFSAKPMTSDVSLQFREALG